MGSRWCGVLLLLLVIQHYSCADEADKSFVSKNYHIVKIPWDRIALVFHSKVFVPALRAANIFASILNSKACIPALRGARFFAHCLSNSIHRHFNPYETFKEIVGYEFSVDRASRECLTPVEIEKAIQDYDILVSRPEFRNVLIAQLQETYVNPDIPLVLTNDSIEILGTIHSECISALGMIPCKVFFKNGPMSVQDFAIALSTDLFVQLINLSDEDQDKTETSGRIQLASDRLQVLVTEIHISDDAKEEFLNDLREDISKHLPDSGTLCHAFKQNITEHMFEWLVSIFSDESEENLDDESLESQSDDREDQKDSVDDESELQRLQLQSGTLDVARGPEEERAGEVDDDSADGDPDQASIDETHDHDDVENQFPNGAPGAAAAPTWKVLGTAQWMRRICSRWTSPRRSGVYALELPNGRFYVGRSCDVARRVRQHLRGQGSAVTRRVFAQGGRMRQVALLTSGRGISAGAWERRETLARMRRFGVDRVRGWRFASRTLQPWQRRAALHELRRGSRGTWGRRGTSFNAKGLRGPPRGGSGGWQRLRRGGGSGGRGHARRGTKGRGRGLRGSSGGWRSRGRRGGGRRSGGGGGRRNHGGGGSGSSGGRRGGGARGGGRGGRRR
jgi:hypothetical protein